MKNAQMLRLHMTIHNEPSVLALIQITNCRVVLSAVSKRKMLDQIFTGSAHYYNRHQSVFDSASYVTWIFVLRVLDFHYTLDMNKVCTKLLQVGPTPVTWDNLIQDCGLQELADYLVTFCRPYY